MSVGKIILKSTTRMSLNDRFTVLRQEKPTGQGQGQAQGSVGIEERRQQTQASRRNQRLAAQMERRPAVVAALKLKKKPQQRNEGFTQKRVLHDQINQRSNVKQRLAVKGRLSLPNNDVRRLTNNRGRAGVRGLRGSTGSFRGMNQRGFGFRGSRGFISNKGGGNISRVVGNGPKGVPTGMRTGMRGSYGGRFTRGVGVSRGGMQGRGGYRGGVHGAGMTGWQTRGLRRTRGLGRGGWINRGGRRGRGGMDIQNGGNFTREQLDEQLDEYMSKTTKSDEYDQHMTDLSM